MERTVHCIKLGKEGPAISRAPFPGELGARLLENVSQEAWTAWLKHQTMLINENRLSPLDPKAKAFLRAEVEQYFFGAGSATPAGFVPEA